MSKRSVSGLRGACALIACASLCAVAGFAQQDAANDPTVKLEKYVVTGSNIPRTEVAGEARTFPVQTIDRTAIETSGIFNTTELLQKMTLSNGGSVPFSNNATGFTPGGTSTSLRGLGPEATLVLINGRRVAPYPVGNGGTTAFVDLNTIPLAAIERVEVLKDGASATYGADAVAGVVNIILRRNYEGATATVSYGNTTNKDSSDFNANLVYGVTSDKGSLTFGANYSSRQPIFNRDRSYSQFPPFFSSNSTPPNLQVTRDAVLAALGLPAGSPITINGVPNTTTQVFFATTGPNTGGDPRTPAAGNKNATNNGLLPASQYTFTTGRSSTFNFNELSGSYPEIYRRGMFLAWERDFFGKSAKFYGDAFFERTRQFDELAPYATGSFFTPGQTTIVIPARTPNPVLTAAEAAAGGRTAVAGAFNPFNPFNQDLAGGSRMRLAEFGNRKYENKNTAIAFTGGLRFDNVADKFTVDAKVRYSEIENADNIRLINTSRLLRAMNANDPIFNPASSSYIGTTVPYNPFGYFRNPIPTNSAPVAFATQYQRDLNTSQMVDGGISISTGDLTDLAAGSVGFALGADFRRESVDQQPDSSLQAGDILGAPPASPVVRQRKIASYFTEFEIPLFSEKNAVPGARGLSLNVAARYENFLTSSRSTFVPKVGVRWTPFDETLVIRSSWGKGYREPALFELFSGKTAGLSPITDPVTGNFEPEQSVTVTGNSRLKSETSRSFNLGAVWSPKGALEGFTAAVDYWHIDRDGQVLANYQDAVNRSVTNNLVAGESIVRDAAGNLVQINTIFRNVGKFRTAGLDLTSSYAWKTATLGRFDTGVTATLLTKFDYQTAPTLPALDYIGQADPRASPGDDGVLKWKGQAWLGWNWHNLNTHLTANYTDGFLDTDGNGDPFKVKSTIFYDLQLSYRAFTSKSASDVKWWTDLKVTVGCNNLLDKDPPFASGGGGNSNGYPGFLYTDEGRFWYVSLEKKL